VASSKLDSGLCTPLRPYPQGQDIVNSEKPCSSSHPTHAPYLAKALTPKIGDAEYGKSELAMQNESVVMQDDFQFIKDEMDSMNGFLLLLTKTETAHND
jgi:hypothetical protein